MDELLWKNIVDFDLDNPLSEYGFSTRLAHLNHWTENFTAKAILEYKKFMYLAATSSEMLSPSEIVDIVWHQHLIFNQSYSDFCKLIGKVIIHTPSVHSKSEREKFSNAKERTIKYYQVVFGSMPNDIWFCESMIEPVFLSKSKINKKLIVAIGIALFLLLFIPAYYFLNPFLLKINNPYFLIFYGISALLLFVSLEMFNRKRFQTLLNRWDKECFLFDLTAIDLIYLKTGRKLSIFHMVVNRLVIEKKLLVTTYDKLKLNNRENIASAIDLAVLEAINEREELSYTELLQRICLKPVFSNVYNSLNIFKKHYKEAKFCIYLFSINYILLLLLLMPGFVRLIMGIEREKPVGILLAILFFLIVFIRFFLRRACNLLTTYSIASLYKNKFLNNSEIKNDSSWSLFLFGSSALALSFVALVNSADRNHNFFGDSTSSSCGSSCGSGCGGGCGGCGGCGGD